MSHVGFLLTGLGGVGDEAQPDVGRTPLSVAGASAAGVKGEVHTRELGTPLGDAVCERHVVAGRVQAVGDQ
jgi:hypothetical protein